MIIIIKIQKGLLKQEPLKKSLITLHLLLR